MGSISQPQSPSQEQQQQENAQPQPQQISETNNQVNVNSASSLQELRQLLELRDQEIRELRFELEKYKLALYQSQLDYHNIQRQLVVISQQSEKGEIQEQQPDTEETHHDRQGAKDKITSADDNLDNLLAETSSQERQPPNCEGLVGKLLADIGERQTEDGTFVMRRRRTQSDHQSSAPEDASETEDGTRIPTATQHQPLVGESLAARLSSSSLGATTSKVLFTPSTRDDIDVQSDDQPSVVEDNLIDDDLDEIIHDVGEIDLNMDLSDMGIDSVKHQQTGVKSSTINDVVRQRGSIKNDFVEDNDNSENGSCIKDDDVDSSNLNVIKHGEENHKKGKNIDNDKDGDEDIISDGLLTSLTDAAISNLSQLAALQERCESQQQQHSHQYQQRASTTTSSSVTATPTTRPITTTSIHRKSNQQEQELQLSQSRKHSGPPCATVVSASPLPLRPIGLLNQHHQPMTSSDYIATAHDPYSASSLANQAAIAINAVAAAAAGIHHHQSPDVTMIDEQERQHHHQQPISSSSSISPNSTIQADLSTSHSLASVVFAAAVAAAAANEQEEEEEAAGNEQHHINTLQHHHQHLQSHHQLQHIQHHQIPRHIQHQLAGSPSPQPQLNPKSRLISSAIASPDFYHNLHQQHLMQQQPSPVSSLNFSPSTSVTPSSSSLLAQSRRSISNASSSLLSPISSPNYLRRQFVPLMSPSPTSGMITGSSSGASSSLAHLLTGHHHSHQQQRSASALGTAPISTGPSPTTVTSSLDTSLGSTGSTAVSPLISNKNSTQARLNNMQIRHKFGYLGSGRAQFNSPHGFCLGLNQEIVVADTNNHRVCIFDKNGSYITQFGSPGKEEGQLWNPRKVAILHRPMNNNPMANQLSLSQLSSSQQQHLNHSASSPYSSLHSTNNSNNNINNNISNQISEPLYVVCDRGAERSRMQLFTKDGVFIKKIGIHYIDIVAGLAITQNGLIIVVDSVSPTVYIINGETGVLNGWFDCSGHMKEPSDIAVKSDIPGNEYFICDFKGHCVVVFSEQGEYLRKIGHDGLTSYPNGIDISDDGDILVGDSHGNRFHVVVFDRNGNFVSQFECPHVKVSRCCGLKITREGYIVTLAKNNHHVLVLDTIHI